MIGTQENKTGTSQEKVDIEAFNISPSTIEKLSWQLHRSSQETQIMVP